jgi:D-3-phosphoglycerate dehydrogenase
MGCLLQGKTVGVIGFGAIGRRVGELVHAFGCRVLYADIASRDVSFAEQASKERLLAESDVVTLHVSGSESILDEDDLNLRIKNGAIVINTARGGLLDEAGLEKALNSGRVAFACLDVFEKEPYRGTLAKLENVILTPHIGSYAREARTKMEEMAVENLLKGLGQDDK